MILRFLIFFVFLAFNLNASDCEKPKMPSEIKYYFSIKDLNKILSFMIKDKKNNSNKINLILLKKIGSTLTNNQYSVEKIKLFLRQELIN